MTQLQKEVREHYEKGEEDALFGIPACQEATTAYYAGYTSIEQDTLL